MTTPSSLKEEYPRSGRSNQNRGEREHRTGGRPELIGVEALAAWLGVEIVFVRRLVSERRIPFVKIGKYVRFDPDEVATWIDGQRVDVARARSNHRARW